MAGLQLLLLAIEQRTSLQAVIPPPGRPDVFDGKDLTVTKGMADKAEQQYNHHNLLLDLPNELTLMVADFLDKDSQVLLSLSCKTLRILLNTHLDLTIHDRATRVRFLQTLEVDHPRYLTCRACAVLYPWRQLKSRSDYHSCSRAHEDEMADKLVEYGRFIYAGDGPTVWATRAVVDLILRAHKYEPSHGLPLSYLNMSGIDEDGICRTTEARIVDGQLVLATRLKVADVNGLLGYPFWDLERRFEYEVCMHIECAFDRYQTVQHVVAMMRAGSETTKVRKCEFCDTDHVLYIKKSARHRMTMVLNVWRNFGRLHSNTPTAEQVFYRGPGLLELDADVVDQRDVRALFESGTGRST